MLDDYFDRTLDVPLFAPENPFLCGVDLYLEMRRPCLEWLPDSSC